MASVPKDTDKVTQIDWLDKSGREVESLTGISITFKDFTDGATLSDLSARYAFWVSLRDGDVTVEGSSANDAELEVGRGGTATVEGNGGDDTLYVWHAKDVTFDGGSGRADTIAFVASYGDPNLTPATQQLVVDLAAGTGKNPYGGTLNVENVENVIGTADADRITGSDQANVIGDPYDTGADIIRAGKGNDVVKLGWAASGGADVDGGEGLDELQFQVTDFNFDSSRIVVDVEHPELNTFVFKGGAYRNLEIFKAGGAGFASDTDIFVFGGGAASEIVTGTTIQSFVGPAFRPAVGRDELSGRGGNDILRSFAGTDILSGGTGNDLLIGGADADRLRGDVGTDTVSYADAIFTGVTASLAKPSGNTGDAKGDAYSSIESLVGSTFGDNLTGNSLKNTLSGGAGNDTLDGGAGRDGLTGGGGNDTFRFTAPLSASSNVDVIDDFANRTGNNDRLALDNAVFKGLPAGALSSAAFKPIPSGSSKKNVDDTDRILYDKAHGDLYFDRDGSETQFARVKFAHVDPGTALSHADIVIV